MTETLLYSLGAVIVAIAAWVMKAEAKEPTAAPPADTHDRTIKAELSDLRKAIERIHETAARHDQDTDDAFRDVGKRMDRIERGVDRICERMDSEARIGAAIAKLDRAP